MEIINIGMKLTYKITGVFNKIKYDLKLREKCFNNKLSPTRWNSAQLLEERR